MQAFCRYLDIICENAISAIFVQIFECILFAKQDVCNIFADICSPMLQAKRLLAVVVGSHDTQQHELSVKEGEKVIW